MAKIITPYSKNKGDVGVDFTEQYLTKEGKIFKRASKIQDLEEGIDCFIDKIPTDVKNTNDIFICQIMTDDGKINTRHPFKKKSKVTHYCIVDVPIDDVTKGNFIEHVNIKERLLRDFIKDEANLKLFYKQLQGLEGKNMKDFGISQSQACFKIKALLLPFLKDNIGLSYAEPEDAEGEISFKLFKSKKRKVNTTPTNFDVKSILAKYKKKDEAIPNLKENIITIDINL